MSEDIEQKLEELKLKEAFESVQKSALSVAELKDFSKKYLTEKTIEAMEKRAYSLMVSYDNGTHDKCIFLTASVPETEEELGAKTIAADLNWLAEQDLIKYTLAPLSSIKLAKIAGSVDASAVFSYVLVPADKIDEIAPFLKCMNQEGELKPLSDLSLKLPQGEVYAVERITLIANMVHEINGTPTASGYPPALQTVIDMYMGALPVGTEFLGATKCAVYDLSIPYELRFRHPLLYGITRIGWSGERRMVPSSDGLAIQGHLLTKIMYFDKNDEEMFV